MTKEDFLADFSRFQKWLTYHPVANSVRGFLPTFIDGDSREYYLTVDDKLKPRTDGKRIYISLIPNTLQPDFGPGEWLVLLRAITAHEAQHINSSNFKDMQEIQAWYGSYMLDNFKMSEKIGADIARNFLNIIEDGRIEAIAVKRRPGMRIPFIFLNDAIRNGTAIEEKAGDAQTEYKHFINQVLSYAKTGLYAPGIQAYENTELEKNFLAVRASIDEGVNAITSADCRMVVEDLLMEISPYLASLLEQSEDLREALEQSDADCVPEYTSNSESEFNNGQQQDSENQENGSSNPLRKVIIPVSNLPAEDGNNDEKEDASVSSASEETSNNPSTGAGANSNGQSSSEAEGSANNNQENSSDSSGYGFGNQECNQSSDISEDELTVIKTLLTAEITAAKKAEEADKVVVGNQLSDKELAEIRQMYKGKTKNVRILRPIISCNSLLPQEFHIQALALRREIMRIIQKQAQQRYTARGLLDPKALWRSAMTDRVFYRKRNPESASAAFYLLIDNSGSMEAYAYCKDDGSLVCKYEAARGAAAILEEAVQNLVPCKIALFDDDNVVNHIVIREFEDASRVNRSWNSLNEIKTGSYNADSINIRIATKELLNRKEKRKILFLLSDGCPSAYSNDMQARVEVKEAVRDARRKGCIVIPIMFGDEDFQKAYAQDYAEMYEKHIISCLPQEITVRLCQLFKTVLTR